MPRQVAAQDDGKGRVALMLLSEYSKRSMCGVDVRQMLEACKVFPHQGIVFVVLCLNKRGFLWMRVCCRFGAQA